MKDVTVYFRVSGMDEQTSTLEQKIAINLYCEMNGLKIVGVVSEISEQGKAKKL